MSASSPSEAALAAIVVRYLRAAGWDTYQEVDDIDVLGLRGAAMIIVETKRVATWDLLGQCDQRLSTAPYVWAAVGTMPCGYRAAHACEDAFRAKGLGLLLIDADDRYGVQVDREFARLEASRSILIPGESIPPCGGLVRQRVAPTIGRSGEPNAARVAALRARLDPRQRDNVAGVPTGGAPANFTPPTSYQTTAAAFRAYVTANPGRKLGEVVSEIEHHYSNPRSAQSALRTHLKSGLLGDVTLRDGRVYIDAVPGSLASRDVTEGDVP
jgi:hypothetical protein